MKLNNFTKSLLRILGATVILLMISSKMIFGSVIPGDLPGSSFRGTPPTLTDEEVISRDNMNRHITHLAKEIGGRYMHDGSLDKAATYIKAEFMKMGYQPTTHDYKVGVLTASNIIVELKGTERPDEILIIGGHYDSKIGNPGANDNGTGTAATLELARIFSGKPQKRTLRFIAFANEEPPYFQTEDMGSLVYARKLKADNDNVIGMLSLETMGYYSDKERTQKYPPPLDWFYPKTGNFIGLVGNRDSLGLLKKSIGIFREHAQIPSEGGIAPEFMNGIGWSDHWSFWQVGYPAIMVTDTAIFRYPHYHKTTDTIDKIQFDALAHVVSGLEHVIKELANE
jgi:Zn-dependent M28 family amino/carboxypeptidase